MRLEEFLKSEDEESVKKFISTINIMEKESSSSLMNQLNDRLTRLNKQITHQQSREASLKRKLDLTNSVLDNIIDKQLEPEIIEILKGFKLEILSMLKKIDYKDQEDERQGVFEIRQRINNRLPIMKRILGIINDANTA